MRVRMFGKQRSRENNRPRSGTVLAIIGAIVLFAGLLAVNIVAQGFEKEPFSSSQYNLSTPSFPQNFLRGSLLDKSYCEGLLIREGDGMISLSNW
jgi:hypothetical protein